MNLKEINGDGSIPHYYHVIAVGIPLVLLTIVIPLVAGTMIRLVMAIMTSHIAATIFLALLWCAALTLYVVSISNVVIWLFSLLPTVIFFLFCSWKAILHFKQKNRNDVVVYSICACVMAGLVVTDYFVGYPLGYPLSLLLLPFLWWWAHRQRIGNWMKRRKARS